MKYDKYIVDFLDGDLPVEHEETLFAAMREDAALRTKMKILLAVKNVSKSHLDNLTVPDKTTAALFGSLGIPNESQVSDTDESKESKSRRKLLLIPGILSIFLIGFLTAYLMFDKRIDSGSTAKSNPGIALSRTKIDNEHPVAKSTPQISKGNTVNKIILRQSSENLNKNFQTDAIESNSNTGIKYLPALDYSNPDSKKASIKSMNYANDISIPSFTFTPDSIDIKDMSSHPHIELSMGRGDLAFLKHDPIYQDMGFPLSNGYVNILYFLSDNFAIGWELRNEQYTISYETVFETTGKSYPNAKDITGLSNSLICQFQTSGTGPVPFGRFSVGWLESGYLLKTTTGLKADLWKNISGEISVEYSNYMEMIDGMNHYSQKLGIIYGLSYRF